MADAVRAWCQDNCRASRSGRIPAASTRRGDFAGGLLGFTDVDNAGLWGLELYYNKELTGQNGQILTAKNAWGYDMPTHYQTLAGGCARQQPDADHRRRNSALAGKCAIRRRAGSTMLAERGWAL